MDDASSSFDISSLEVSWRGVRSEVRTLPRAAQVKIRRTTPLMLLVIVERVVIALHLLGMQNDKHRPPNKDKTRCYQDVNGIHRHNRTLMDDQIEASIPEDTDGSIVSILERQDVELAKFCGAR